MTQETKTPPSLGDYTEEMRACAEAIDLGPAAIVRPEDRWADLNGIRFHYLDWGNDHLPHLVLLHGGSLTAHTWDMASLLLRDRYHVIALDQRGHGDTGWTPEERIGGDNGDLMLDDTKAFLDHLGYDHVVLCGMSMGGMNAIRYAARDSERLAALIVVDIAPVTMQAGLVEMEQFREDTETMHRFEDFLERAMHFNPQRKPDHLRYSLLHSLKPIEEGWTWKQDHRRRPMPENITKERIQELRTARAEAMWSDVRAIETPTLLMRGALSNILSEEAAAGTVEAMPDCELVVVEGAGHSVQGDNPKDFAAGLDAFVTRRGLFDR